MNPPTWPANPTTGWFKSSRSNPSQNCVEVRFDGESIRLRDSKDRGAGPIITVAAEHWPSFLSEVTGEASSGTNDAVHIEHTYSGEVRLCAPGATTVLTYTPAEWAAFIAGVLVGEFDQDPAAVTIS